MVDFCLNTSREEVRAHRRRAVQRHHRAGAAAASALLALLRADQAGSRLRHLCAGLRHHGLLVLRGDAGRLAPIRSSTSRCSISMPAIRSQPASTSRGDRAAQRQHRLRGRRRDLDRQPRGRAALRQRSRSDAQSRHPRGQLPQPRAMEDPRDAGAAATRASHHRLPEAAGGERRLRQSALAHLLSAGALLRLFRPLLRGVPGAAAGGAGGDRSRRRVRFHPRHACWPMCRTN